ncbi:unnamed protein product [Ectocarpus sp. CCAP 1310/34]|nr:unnamed protein product [Ectocarpus sp. CCAP 1310/34]
MIVDGRKRGRGGGTEVYSRACSSNRGYS